MLDGESAKYEENEDKENEVTQKETDGIKLTK